MSDRFKKTSHKAKAPRVSKPRKPKPPKVVKPKPPKVVTPSKPKVPTSGKITVNGTSYTVATADMQMPLLWYIRDVLGLTGTKYGCGIEICAACTVLVNGEREKSCDMDVKEAIGRQITTIEGLSADSSHPLQQAWVALQVPQCGYCQSGVLLAFSQLLKKNPNPSDAAIDGALKNICMCGTYPRMREAVKEAARIAKLSPTGKAI